jgi:RNA polymerase sigma-70 factor (ECF subfamily)
MSDPPNHAEPSGEPRDDGHDRPRRSTGPAQDPAADAWLVGKARSGDPAAYEALVRRHRVRVYRIALRMLGNHEDAEDVAQDTFVQVWSTLAGFVGRAQFTTWLYRIVINRCLNHKRRRPSPVALRDEDHPTGTGPEDTVVGEHRARATAAAIAALPADQRTVLVLHQMEGLTYQEVADILKLPEPTVRGRLARARRTLLTELRDWA